MLQKRMKCHPKCVYACTFPKHVEQFGTNNGILYFKTRPQKKTHWVQANDSSSENQICQYSTHQVMRHTL